MEINCTACDELRDYAPEFVQSGVTNKACNSLANDTGLSPDARPLHTDAPDLHDANDCLIGNLGAEIETYDVCDWQDFMELYLANQYAINKSLICSIGGIWENIHDHETRISNLEKSLKALQDLVDELLDAIGGGGSVVPVIRRYRITVPKSAFKKVWRVTSGAEQNSTVNDGTENWYNVSNITEWFAGSGNNENVGEFWVKVPVSEMDNIVGVWTQTWVVPGGNSYDGKGKAYIQTVNVQEWTREGNFLNVNFDTYELCPPGGGTAPNNGGPYPVTVDFLVVGTRTLS